MYADYKTLLDIVKGKLKGETQQDDKTMIMERTIQLVAALPNHSRTQEKLTNSFIDKLWNSLDHPPLLYVGPESKYRRPDGAYNVSSLETVAGRMGTSSFVHNKTDRFIAEPNITIPRC